VVQAHIVPVVRKLRARRKALGLSQADVDEILGIADRQCGKWEVGLRVPTAYSLSLWAQGLGCELTISPAN